MQIRESDIRGLQLRYLLPILLISGCLAALSILTAVSLFGQQQSITQVLSENVTSQRAAVELEECLHDLIALEDDHVRSVSVLHDRTKELMNSLYTYADQPEEQRLHSRMSLAFAQYLKQWSHLPAVTADGYEVARRAATEILTNDVLKSCQEFEAYNLARVGESAQHHEQVLRQLAWGMTGVGVMGTVAGLVTGYGVARGLTRSIRRLQIHLRDAAGKLSPVSPEIVFTEVGDFFGLHAEIDRLSLRIEQVVRDLQDREREVLRAEQLAAVGQLAAGLAHEIRNPLTSIKLLAQAAQDEDSGLSYEDLRVIEAEIRRMEQSLNTFLDFARPQHLQRTTFSVHKLVHDVFDLLRLRAERQKVQLRADIPDTLCLTADAEQLRQVLVNLGLNAMDAMPCGGQIRVIADAGPNELIIRVIDMGPGISESILPRLFTPFASTKDTGLGLGLVISRRIIEAHGGTLTALNSPDGGAEFTIRLPRENA